MKENLCMLGLSILIVAVIVVGSYGIVELYRAFFPC